MSSYVDFTYYSVTYLGNKIPQAEFDRSALRASVYLGSLTMGNIPVDSVPDSVKNACCAVAEVIYIAEQQTTASNVISERIGDYSVSYDVINTDKVYKKQLLDAAKLYLSGTGLLFRGIGI